MKSLFNATITHVPEKIIPRYDYIYLGYVDNYDVRLVVEDGEFRVYNYEWWSWETIDADHHDEDWWGDLGDIFEGGCDCYDKDNCEYSVAEFDSDNPLEMALELANVCEDELEDTSYVRADSGVVKQSVIDFITRGMEKVKKYKDSFVYCYYK